MKQNITITTKSCLGFQSIQAAGWQVVKLSSNANNSANTGAFYMNANNTSSNLNQNIGSQLTLLLKTRNKNENNEHVGDLASRQNT